MLSSTPAKRCVSAGAPLPVLLFLSFFSHDFRFLSPVRPFTTRFGISSRPHGRTRHLESGGLCGDLDLLGQGYSRAASLGDLSLYFIPSTVDKIRYHCGLKGQLHTNIIILLTPIIFCQPSARSQVPSRLYSLGPRSLPASHATRALARPRATGSAVAYGTCREHVFDACFDLPVPLRGRYVANGRPLCVGPRSTGERPLWS